MLLLAVILLWSNSILSLFYLYSHFDYNVLIEIRLVDIGKYLFESRKFLVFLV